MIASNEDDPKDDPDADEKRWERFAATRLENLPKQKLGAKLSNGGEEGDIYK